MADLTERLKLVVDATTGNAESSFDRMTTSAERSARSADDAADAVGRAADAVAQARNREADASGKLSVAEARLQELRDKGNATTSQLVAAEERVASAQRNVQLAAGKTEAALEQQEAAQRGATDAADDSARAHAGAGDGANRYGEQVGKLKAQMVGLVAGVSVADWLGDSVRGYLDGARGASALAQSMNATTEEGGQLLTLVGSLGLEMNDLLEIQAEFASQVAADDELLSSFGATVKENDDGTVNWALTLEDALASLQKIPDATTRNATGFRIFGEEGYKQLSRLLLSGRSVEEALEQIGTPFSDEDVEATRRYDAAMLELSATGGSVARTLGSFLVPVITEVLGGIGSTVDAISEVPTPLAVAIALTLAYAAANRFTAESGGAVAATQTALTAGWGRMTGAVAGATVGTGAFAVTAGVARAAGAGLMTVLGGPLGLAILGLGAGFTLLTSVMGSNEDQAEGVAKAQDTLTSALKESNGVVTQSVRQQAALAAQEAGVLSSAERAGVSRGEVTRAILEGGEAYDSVRAKLEAYALAQTTTIQDADGYVTSTITAQGQKARDSADALEELRGTSEGTAEEQRQLAGELGQTTDKTALAEAAMDALTSALEAGGVSTATLSELAKGAAEAQDAEARSADRAKAAIEAHNAVTRDAVDATRERIDAIYSAESAEFAWLDALDAANSATDDGTTRVNEQREAQVALMNAALAAADAAADAAVETREAAGEVLTDLDRADVRATTVLENLRGRLNTPGLSKGARDELQGLIDQLATAQDKGDIEAVLRLTGAPETAAELDETTEDREATVTVESRGGPAVSAYLNSIARADRLALVNVESRGGPAVDAYLDSLSVGRDRLAIIRVETRGGPDVERYIDGLARERLTIIRLETRGGPAVQRYLDDLTADREARIGAVGRGAPGMYGAPSLAGAQIGRAMVASVSLDLELVGRVDREALSKSQRGKARVDEIRAYERENGTGWRR